MKNLLFIFLLVSCGTHNSSEKKSILPDKSLVADYNIGTDQILYQYYEKFGFTDLCVHHRTLFYVHENIKLNNWNKLPMLEADINKVNSLHNKLDSLNGDSISVVYNYKNVFSDISLKLEEYFKDTIFDKELALTDGYYRINSTVFELYNPGNKTIYLEYHECDY